jgi:hypothetical protein
MLDALRTFYGARPDVSRGAAPDDVVLEAARKKAMVELAALAPRFTKGIPDRERLLVEAPFPNTHHQPEWMWVEVRSWHGDTLRGILVNQPLDVPSLRQGAAVTDDILMQRQP